MRRPHSDGEGLISWATPCPHFGHPGTSNGQGPNHENRPCPLKRGGRLVGDSGLPRRRVVGDPGLPGGGETGITKVLCRRSNWQLSCGGQAYVAGECVHQLNMRSSQVIDRQRIAEKRIRKNRRFSRRESVDSQVVRCCTARGGWQGEKPRMKGSRA